MARRTEPQQKPSFRPPGIRVDGGRRVNLSAQRAKKKAIKEGNRPLRPQPTVEQVKARTHSEKKRRREEAKRIKQLSDIDGGKEGASLTTVKVRLSAHRSETMAMRARPGTFEWRYGRNKQDALFHAGSHLAQLWERAGMTTASSADFMRGIASGFSTGISEGRVRAIEKLEGFRSYLGTAGAERMIGYCVLGLTSSQIAVKESCEERAMSTVLHHDLRKSAEFLGFVPKPSRKRNVDKAHSGHEMT